ncbi:BREX-1 system adenine-specific DNA-methyltransferase PglX [Caproiciproducens sp. CPB-2]|uniref:BREX-1 system adenine-specific DNA-methyltransferase PglX n=1 Tax=Caproiciproducens sp. CPB-2 TaxID=3030017 RepID=UPI0023D9D37A|nr:BREX-1 system adenine-specific DNA-methyltransferase PglX [Caproiciproducens sp. CPB-2]MDF1493741.1 BREX-1 system adenine-specific DNA-methyltransferase PglX [Caproiciproducens sp. CPB-2]
MDKNAIKKYAVWARRELISRVSQKAQQFGITEKEIVDANADSVNGRLLSPDEKKQRQALIAKIKREDYEQVMEEVAYTWFNRFSALRFMEVNGYLPSHVRVFTDDEGSFKPQILAEAIHLDLDGLDMDKVYALKEKNDDEALFKYLIITQCNALSDILPGMFQRISDYTELLFPDNLLREGSVLEQMIMLIPEEDWKDQVQIIGWLYQYYNTEPKDKVFADLKKNIKITKENIPAATQLFTPDWIVRYMVENSLGRLWLEHLKAENKPGFSFEKVDFSHFSFDSSSAKKAETLKANWKYYLDEAEQEPEVQAELTKIRESYKSLKPEDIKCIDPCMGSGHILVYMFDVLMQIYSSYGYNNRDAVKSIIENNLYGLDIDDRAAQLAYFSVIMKARQYDSRFFSRELQPHVYAIRESNGLDPAMVEYFVHGDPTLKEAMNTLIPEMRDAKEYGSILDITLVDFDALYARFDAIRNEISMFNLPINNDLLPFVQVAQAMTQKYSVVCTNPPYMGSNGMSVKLSDYVKGNYPDTKSDMSTVCMEKTISMCKSYGYMAMINIPVWMFLSSYEKLRKSIINNNTITSMVHPGRGIFGSDFGTTSFVIGKAHISGYRGSYRRLFEKLVEVESIEVREQRFFENRGCYTAAQENYTKIPGSPIAYWVSQSVYTAYDNQAIGNTVVPRHGLATSDNDRFLKLWFEINVTAGSLIQRCNFSKKWFPINKGGAYRKWYGNLEWVINYKDDGKEIKAYATKLYRSASRTIQNTQFYFRQGITWSALTSGSLSFRWTDIGAIFGSGAHCAFTDDDNTLLYALGLMNSKVNTMFLNIVSATMNKNVDDIRATPFIMDAQALKTGDSLVRQCIGISKSDWDSFETSWDFKTHPLIAACGNYEEAQPLMVSDDIAEGTVVTEWSKTSAPIVQAFNAWERETDRRFSTLKANEEELNRIFIDIYGLQDELTPEEDDKDVTVRKADLKRDIKSLLSYAVGCMFGRYSLDVEGLAYAGGEWDASKYKTFIPDKDNIIPICDDEYFEDDITGRFLKFIETVYGKDTLDENLRFIADALGGSGQPKNVIRNYFLNDFYADHLKIYQKRPIYWLFDSGKKNGFKALIYMHRYAPDTLARMRTDYVHEQQARYHTAIADVEHRMENASASERVKLNKQLAKLQDQAEEIRLYEEKIHHLADQMIRIDLDDGVNHNYAIFEDVLAKIK